MTIAAFSGAKTALPGSFHCGCYPCKHDISIECEIQCPLFLYELTVPGGDIEIQELLMEWPQAG